MGDDKTKGILRTPSVSSTESDGEGSTPKRTKTVNQGNMNAIQIVEIAGDERDRSDLQTQKPLTLDELRNQQNEIERSIETLVLSTTDLAKYLGKTAGETRDIFTQIKEDVALLLWTFQQGKPKKLSNQQIDEYQIALFSEIEKNYRQIQLAQLAQLAQQDVVVSVEQNESCAVNELRDATLKKVQTILREKDATLSDDEKKIVFDMIAVSQSVLQTVAKKIIVSEIAYGHFPTFDSVTQQLQNFVAGDSTKVTEEQKRNVTAAVSKEYFQKIAYDALSALNNNKGGAIFYVTRASTTEENIISENRRLDTVSFSTVSPNDGETSVQFANALIFPEVEEYIADAIQRLLQKPYANAEEASKHFDLAVKAYKSCKEELLECKNTKLTHEICYIATTPVSAAAEKLLKAKMQALQFDSAYQKKYKDNKDAVPDADRLKAYAAICKARIEYRKTFYDIKVKNGAWDNNPYSAKKKFDAASTMSRYLDSILNPDKKNPLPKRKAEEKFPDSFAAKDGKLHSTRKSIQSLFGEFKDDLKYCRKAEDAGKLFKALCVLRDAEKSYATNTDTTKNTELELKRIKCALQYRKSLYEVRSYEINAVSSFFKASFSVAAKMKATIELLKQVSGLLEKQTISDVDLSVLSAAKDGQLGALYKQLDAVKSAVSAEIKNRSSIVTSAPTPKP